MKAALTGNPETKTIIFPMWRDEEKYYYFLDEIVGAVIFWAIRQSPYDYPEFMEDAADRLTVRLKKKFDWSCECIPFTGDEIENMLLVEFKEIPEIMAWNEQKTNIEKKRIEGRPHPDNDIIDLDALARNVSHTLLLQKIYDKD